MNNPGSCRSDSHHGTNVTLHDTVADLRLRGAVHYALFLVTRDPERLYKTNKTWQFLAHDDYSVFRKGTRPAPTSYPR